MDKLLDIDNERRLDIDNERRLEAKYGKQMQCLIHEKRCATCEGKDVSGEDCKYFKGGGMNGHKENDICGN